MTPRRLILSLVAFIVILAVGYGVFWYSAIGIIRGVIEDWAETRRAEGFVVTYDSLTIDGFPGTSVVTVIQPVIGGWSAPRLVAEIDPFALDRITITLPETQRFAYQRDGEERVVEMTAERGIVRVSLATQSQGSVAIVADGVTLETPKGQFTLTRLTGLLRRGPEARIEVEIDGENLLLAPQINAILGHKVALFGLTAAHDGTLPAALSGPGLAVWSEAGGTVDITRLILQWGDVDVTADGALTVDGKLRPQAAFSAEIAGYGGLLKVLVENGRMKQRDASFARTFLNLMAKKKAGRRVIKAPVTAQNGKLYVGPIPLLILDPIF